MGATHPRLVIWKLCILVLHGLRMCMWFWGYPAIIFFHSLFCTFQLGFFFSCDTMTWVACGRNSSYSFIPNFLKLCSYIYFFHDLKICMCFWAYAPVIFINFFHFFYVVFRSLLVSETLRVQLILQFPHIIFKLCILVLHGLKMCV